MKESRHQVSHWLVVCIPLGAVVGSVTGVIIGGRQALTVGIINGLVAGVFAGISIGTVGQAARDAFAESLTKPARHTTRTWLKQLGILLSAGIISLALGASLGRLVSEFTLLAFGIANTAIRSIASGVFLWQSYEFSPEMAEEIGLAIGMVFGILGVWPMTAELFRKVVQCILANGEPVKTNVNVEDTVPPSTEKLPVVQPTLRWPEGFINRVLLLVSVLAVLVRGITLTRQLWFGYRLGLLEIRSRNVEIAIGSLGIVGILLLTDTLGRRYSILLLGSTVSVLGKLIVDIPMLGLLRQHSLIESETIISVDYNYISLEIIYTVLKIAAILLYVIGLLRGERADHCVRDYFRLMFGRDREFSRFLKRVGSIFQNLLETTRGAE